MLQVIFCQNFIAQADSNSSLGLRLKSWLLFPTHPHPGSNKNNIVIVTVEQVINNNKKK